jgi:hypothetical protein
MNTFTRITVPLLKDDFFALRDAAAKEYRDPRQHAAWLLRLALGTATEQPMQISDQTQNGAGNDLAVTSAVL